SEYPDVHAFGVVVVFVTLYLALLVAFPHADTVAPSRRRRRALSTLVGWCVLSFAFVGAASLSLRDRNARLRLTEQGQNSRWLIRVLRTGLDFDADGSAQVFGGPDCDDFDPKRGPHAREILDNKVDEDCDGIANGARPPGASRAGGPPPHLDMDALDEARAALSRWREGPEVRAQVAALRRPNFVLISIDALRADVLRDSPDNRARFPNLFALLDESRRFEHAFAPAAGTDLSMSTLMT